MTEYTGRCFCGSVSWSTPGPILWSVHCHCESCRRSGSAAFASFFGVPRNSLSRNGETRIHDSSPRVRREHCPKCGSQVFIETDIWPDEIHVFAATLDEPGHFKPQAHVHWLEKADWVEINDQLPKYPGSADNTEPLDD